MKKICRALVIALAWSGLALSPAQSFDPARASVVFANLAADPNLKDPSVILIDPTTGQTLFESNSEALRKPASTLKILAAVSVAKYLDPQMRFQTSLSLASETGAVVIQGDFDPWTTLGKGTADRLGITSINYLAYSAQTAVDRDSEIKTKSLTIYYNGIYDSEALSMKKYLKTRKVNATLKEVSAIAAQRLVEEPIMNSQSPTVTQISRYFTQWSDNVLSERMSRIAARAAGFTSDAKGIAALYKSVLRDMDIDGSKIIVKDGSGLSHDNRLSAAILGKLLLKIHTDPAYAKVVESLPDGGINGTLNERFIKTAPQAIGLVHAKTGTLIGTVTLAGYVESVDREYIFVVLADRLSRSYSAAKLARDTLDRYLGKIALPLLPVIVITQVVETTTPINTTVSSTTP